VSGGSETGQPIIDNTINTIATDGNGVFLVGSDAGDVAESTDNGASWTQIVNGFTYNGNRKFEAIRANVYLPV
jgi:dihydroorotate dehydrogenase